MPAILIVVLGLVAYYVGWRLYSKFIAEKVFRLDPAFRTPAHEFEDGSDFVPTNKHVLWGHHFTSVAGAAPIVGPAIAVFWGWLPAVLWVVLGTIFFAGVHDFGTLWISSRHRAQSMGSLSADVVSRNTRSLFMIVIFLLLLMVNAVFAIVIARLFVKFPGSVIPIWIEIPIAIAVGFAIVRKGKSLLVPSLISLVLLYVFIYVGDKVPLSLPETTFGLPAASVWVILLFVYAFVASRLPVWILLQPRDFINSHQLFVALGVIYLGVMVSHPSMVAPAINPDPIGAPPMVPLLFITIACGAISGFHGLVSSGTTSKQLDKETDARPVGYLGAVGEGSLALGAIIAVTAGLAATQEEWLGSVYTDWTAASGGAAAHFVNGVANLVSHLGIPVELGQVFASVVVISFAATTMDTGVRLQRYIVAEIGETYGIKVLRGPTVSTTIAVAACLLLAFGAHAPGGGVGTGGLVIWPLFGTTNQLLAALSLVVIAVYLKKKGRKTWPALVPMVFLTFMTTWAMLSNLGRWLLGDTPNYLLGGLGLIVLGAAAWMILEAIRAFAGVKGATAEEQAG
jgi:carbon starvation protein